MRLGTTPCHARAGEISTPERPRSEPRRQIDPALGLTIAEGGQQDGVVVDPLPGPSA
jgi:hypothetical protein